MDQKTVQLISERLAKNSSPAALIKQYNDNIAAFRNMPLTDFYYSTIWSLLNECTERNELIKKITAHRKAVRRKTDRMRQNPQSYIHKFPKDYNADAVDQWILSPENENFIYFFSYPYFHLLDNKKKQAMIRQDLTSIFYQSLKQYNYSLTNYYTYFTSDMSSYPFFGMSKSKKHEVTLPSKDTDTDISYYRGMSNGSYFEMTRSEKSRPLDTDHKKLYEFILKKYVEKKYYNISNEPPGINSDDLFVWEHEMISHMGLESHTYAQASKQIAAMIYDITDLRLDLMSDPESRIITGRTGLIGPYYQKETFEEDGKFSYGYHFEHIESGLFTSYIQDNLLRTAVDDVKKLTDNANLLMPFFVNERILLYNAHSISSCVTYDAQIFLSKLRLYIKTVDKLLETLKPILEEYCSQGIQIKSYHILEHNIQIEYIPLTKAEYEAMIFSLRQ